MVLCQRDQCTHLVAITDTFEGQEFIIGYRCEEGFPIELNEDTGYARMAQTCEQYERKEE